MDSNCENIITSQLKINTTYELKFPHCQAKQICKLITKHDTTKNYEILYTFIDNYGNKIGFTNSVFKNMTVNEYIEPLPIIKTDDIQTVINVNELVSLGLPSNNKNFVPPIISINSYINQQNSNLIDDDDLYG
jgi:hypothetical protein